MPGPSHPEHDRTLVRLEKMVTAGRVTPEEAARVRESRDDVERDAAITAIRTRHVIERINRAVAARAITVPEGNELLARLAAGEDPTTLRDVLPRVRRQPGGQARPDDE